MVSVFGVKPQSRVDLYDLKFNRPSLLQCYKVTLHITWMEGVIKSLYYCYWDEFENLGSENGVEDSLKWVSQSESAYNLH